MMIRRMTASFGKLENATLELHEGMNVFSLPNESGKSTWAAFLVAMLYGIDTGERTKKGVLAFKEKYKPWSGHSMEGTLELTWQGKNITIQRTTEGRIPMGKFRAFDTDSGEDLAFLTAENCGKTLLGVERSVFLRSAFIGQNGLTVSADPSLEQRLGSLVTTGDESVSYTKTEKRLRDWKNHVRHNRTGYLPETEAALREVEEKLTTIHRCHKEALHHHARRAELEEKTARLQYIEKNLKAADAMRKYRQLQEAEQNLALAQGNLQELRKGAEALPTEEALQRLQKDLDELRLLQQLQQGKELPTPPQKPQTAAVFDGMTAEEAVSKAAQDREVLQNLGTYKCPGSLVKGAIGLLIAGIVLCFFHVLSGLLVIILTAIAFLVRNGSCKNAYKMLAEQAQNELLKKYGARDAEGILLAAAAYGESLRSFEQAEAVYRSQAEALQAAEAQLKERTEALLTAVRGFAPSIYTEQDAANAILNALSAYNKIRAAERETASAAATRDALRAAVGDVTAAEAVEDFSQTHSLPQVQQQLAAARQELQEVSNTLSRQEGLVQSLGDPAALEAERQALTETLDRLNLRNNALALAMETLDGANEQLRSRFSPQISDLAGTLLGKMTGGRYDGVRLMQDMTMDVHPTGDSVRREQLFLSSGTADQLYLALRLAICRMTLGEDAPLVLDDALVYFDDDRLKAAMALLREEAQTRQILLFTCQNRELDAYNP